MNAYQKLRPITRLWLLIGLAVAALGLFTYIYQAEPLPSPWEDIAINGSYVLASAWGAAIATRIGRKFGPGEPPRQVWLYFAGALWVWALAEGVWGTYALIYGEDFPPLSGSDIFYVLGVALFVAALAQQYRLVSQPSRRQGWLVIGGSIAIVVGLSLGGAFLLNGPPSGAAWGGDLINIFYTLSDIGLALAALLLIRTFGGGLWARPWLALLIFALSDGLYTWLVSSGRYNFTGGNDLASLIADSSYLVAYLVLALLCQTHLYLLRYGPRWRKAQGVTP